MGSRLKSEVLDGLRALLGERVDASASTCEAYGRDLSTLGHLGYATEAADGGPGYAPPDVVVHPRTADEVAAIARLCHQRGVPLIPWGAGSGVSGGTLAVRGGVALDLKGLDRIDPVDRVSQLVRVEAGVNLQLLEDALTRQGYTLAHHPSSITCSTIGGAVAARGAGQLSTRYGKIEDMVAGVEVVLADGTRVATPVAPRAATGPDWNHLFTGCEGTLGIIVAQTLRVQRLPALRRFLAFEFPDLEAAFAAIRESLQRGARPAAVRLYDPLDTLLVAGAGDGPPPPPAADQAPAGTEWPLAGLSLDRLAELLAGAAPDLGGLGKRALLGRPALANRLTRSLPGVGCLLLLTCEGEPELAQAEARLVERVCREVGGRDRGPQPAERWWRNRIAVSHKQTGVYALGGFVDTMEVATSWSRLGALHDQVRAAIAPHALVMAHFSHAYLDGCSIYFTFAGLRDGAAETIERHQRAWQDGLAAAVACGAVISHHHGVGTLKADALRASHGALHSAVFVPIKGALDPRNVLNPGKLGLP